MGKRLTKLQELQDVSVKLNLTPINHSKLLLSKYLQRLQEKVSFVPRPRLRISFAYDGGEVSLFLRSNNIDYRHLAPIFVRREWSVPVPNALRILDLGGNIGAADVFYHSQYRNAEIVVVEPLPDNLAVLRENWKANAIRGRIIPAAISCRSGKAKFYLSEVDNCSLVLRSDMKGHAIEVDCVTVPQIMEQARWDDIDILKVDIEGGEKSLFQNCGEWINRVKVIVGELHDGYTVEQFDRDLGGRFQCKQTFQYGAPGYMQGVFAVRKAN
jgi:FkbM family methyltransferase